MLFSASVLAQTTEKQVEVTPEEFTEFVSYNIMRGKGADLTVYAGYVNQTFKHGTGIEIMTIAMQYAACSIMWRTVMDNMVTNDDFTEEMVLVTHWRAVELAKIMLARVGGKPERIETNIIPFLNDSPDADLTVGESSIYTCTALDSVAFHGMKARGAPTQPPADWKLEPIPEPEIPSLSPGTAS